MIRLAAGLGRAGLALAGLLLLAGCGVFEPDRAPFSCPRTFLVADADTATLYREGPGRDLTDVRFVGRINGVTWQCAFHEDGYVDQEITVGFAAARGPAADVRDVGFDYFVAVVAPSGQIVRKQVFHLNVVFEGGNSVVFTRIVGTTIFLADPAEASSNRIFVGFELTPEQLQENRRVRGVPG